MYELMMGLGVANLAMVVFMLLTGLRVVKVHYKVHRRVGVALTVGAFLHGGLAMMMYM